MTQERGRNICMACLTGALSPGIGSPEACSNCCGMLYSLDPQRCYEYWVSMGLHCDSGRTANPGTPPPQANTEHANL